MKSNWTNDAAFTQAFSDLFMANRAEDLWGNGYFHPSDATNCRRSIYYRMLREIDPESLPLLTRVEKFSHTMTMEIGHAVHRQMQEHLVRMGLCGEEDIEVPVRIEDINLKGSIDAIVCVESFRKLCEVAGIECPELSGTHIVLDLKTKKDSEIATRLPTGGKETKHTFPDKIFQYPDAGYYTQVQIYMALARRLYAERYQDIQMGIILYFCKNDGRPASVRIAYEPQVYDDVRLKAKGIQHSLLTREAPPRDYGKQDGHCRGWLINGEYQYGCKYYNVCWSPEAPCLR